MIRDLCIAVFGYQNVVSVLMKQITENNKGNNDESSLPANQIKQNIHQVPPQENNASEHHHGPNIDSDTNNESNVSIQKFCQPIVNISGLSHHAFLLQFHPTIFSGTMIICTLIILGYHVLTYFFFAPRERRTSFPVLLEQILNQQILHELGNPFISLFQFLKICW